MSALRLVCVREPIEQRFPRPSVMGVVNVTPDSFSDAGVNYAAEDAIVSRSIRIPETLCSSAMWSVSTLVAS